MVFPVVSLPHFEQSHVIPELCMSLGWVPGSAVPVLSTHSCQHTPDQSPSTQQSPELLKGWGNPLSLLLGCLSLWGEPGNSIWDAGVAQQIPPGDTCCSGVLQCSQRCHRRADSLMELLWNVLKLSFSEGSSPLCNAQVAQAPHRGMPRQGEVEHPGKV